MTPLPKMIEAGEIRSCGHLRQFVAIQVNETDVLRPELRLESALDEDEVRVSLMAWPLADNDGAGAEPEKFDGAGGKGTRGRRRTSFDPSPDLL